MEKSEIKSFTLAQLKHLMGTPESEHINDEYLVGHGETTLEIFRYPFRIDAFMIGICTGGEAVISTNLSRYKLEENTLFVIGPNNIIQQHEQERLSSYIIALSRAFMQRIHIDLKKMMPLLLRIAEQPVLRITDEQSRMLGQYIDSIEAELRKPATLFTQEIVGGLISVALYKIGDLLHQHFDRPEETPGVKDRANEYFKRFMLLLGEHYKEQRAVGFYARELCITPKYLTTVIKRVSGRSASEWIDSYVILEAKTLLKYSDMSIQEIAYYLNFPNQSFFGSYFKRNAGLSPSRYKAQ